MKRFNYQLVNLFNKNTNLLKKEIKNNINSAIVLVRALGKELDIKNLDYNTNFKTLLDRAYSLIN